MFRSILIVVINLLFVRAAECKTIDTNITYFKYDRQGSHKVSTLDSADYFRMILPPDSGETLNNIKEFYKNGKVMLVGKADQHPDKSNYGQLLLEGDCIMYYPNWKKQSMTHYNKGNKDGDEYLFFPDGSIYCYRKYTNENLIKDRKLLNMDCYNLDGKITCKNDNGEWLIYDREYKNILIRGRVVNGDMEGDWHGYVPDEDSIKYTIKYNKGFFVSGIGYDKAGTAYPFTMDEEGAYYGGGSVNVFIDDLNRHLKVPKGSDGKKISLDTLNMSFIVEKNGHASDAETLGFVNKDLNEALDSALSKCDNWKPSKIYGIPYRTKCVVPLKYLSWTSGRLTYMKIFFNQEILRN